MDRVLVVGLAAGILSGLLGVGGGLIIVPGLVLAASVPQRIATATSLAAVIPIALTGAILFGTSGHIALDVALALAIGSVAGSQVGSAMLRRAPDVWVRRSFAIFLLATAAVLVLQ